MEDSALSATENPDPEIQWRIMKTGSNPAHHPWVCQHEPQREGLFEGFANLIYSLFLVYRSLMNFALFP